MAYATPDELAQVLRVKVTPENSELLDSCVNAAAEEIDHWADRFTDSPIDPADPLAHMVNLARGVEWFKSNDSAFGALGFDNTGVLTAPSDQFARHARNLIPLKHQYGVA